MDRSAIDLEFWMARSDAGLRRPKLGLCLLSVCSGYVKRSLVLFVIYVLSKFCPESGLANEGSVTWLTLTKSSWKRWARSRDEDTLSISFCLNGDLTLMLGLGFYQEN